MDRRDFLRLVGVGAASTAIPSGILGCGGDEGGPTIAETGPALSHRTPTSLITASRDEIDVGLHVISGELPRDIYGHAFTICAIPHGDGSPAFNGDGMMYRISFDGARPALRTRMAKTPSWYVDQATRGTDDGFSNRGFTRISSKWGVHNQANTAFMPMGERMLATYDGGRPYEIDPHSMEVITPVGAQSEWESSLPDSMSSGPFTLFFSTAHPYYDEHADELFTVNFRGEIFGEDGTFTNLMRWDTEGELENWTVKLPDGTNAAIKQSIHQIGVTQDYVLIMDTAFFVEGQQFSDPSYAEAQSPDTVIYVISRGDLSAGSDEVVAQRVVIEREAAHFLCDYENPGGEITLHLAHNCASDASEWVREDDVLFGSGDEVRQELAGTPTTGTDIGILGRHTIDGESGEVVESELVWDPEFTWSAALYAHKGAHPPGQFEDIYWISTGFSDDRLTERMVDLYRDYPHRKVGVNDLQYVQKPASLCRLDVRQMGIADGYIFPPGRHGLSPQFVPRMGSTGRTDGYVVCTVMSDDESWAKSTGDEFWIFDAANLQQGPLCRLGHPQLDLPFTLHTTWMPEVQPRTANYKIPAREDFAERMQDQPEDVEQMFEENVYPHFTA